MRRTRNAKIVATLGPASSSEDEAGSPQRPSPIQIERRLFVLHGTPTECRRFADDSPRNPR